MEEGELQKAFILQFILFLLITTLLLLKPTVYSLFLSALSADALPVAFMLTAIFAALGSKFYTLSQTNYRLISIIKYTLYGTIALTLIFAVAFHYQLSSAFLMYSVYVFVAIYGLLVTSQFWLMTNVVYNIRQAKRTFGFIGAGGIAGGILGGYFTSILAQLMPSEYILFVAAFLLLCCVYLYNIFWRREQNVSGIISRTRNDETSEKGQTPFKTIRKSRLLTLIAIVTGLSVLIAKLIDYQFSDFAIRNMGNTEKLSAFFGIWLSNISIISLLIQLFLTERIIKFFGVGSTMLIMPGGILLGSVLLLLIPELWVVVFIKVIDGSFKQSVNKSAKELMFMPVPFEAKKKAKTVIDVVVDSLATGLAGIILFFFIKAFDVSSAYVSIIILVMLIVEVIMIIRLKAAYRESFRILAQPPPVRGEMVVKPRPKAPSTSIPKTITWILKNGTDSQVLHMLHRIFEYPNKRFSIALKGLLNHQSAEIRSMSVKSLYHLRGEDNSEVIEKLVHDTDQTTATQAMRYLINRRSAGKKELFERYFYCGDRNVTNSALVAMAKELRNNRRLQQKYNFEKYIKYTVNLWQQEKDEKIKQSILEAILLAIGNAKVNSYYKLLEQQLTTTNEQVLLIALKAASRTRDFRFLDLIVSSLSNKSIRHKVEEALFNYGQAVIPQLKQKVFEGIKDFHDSIFIPQVIEKFENRKAMKALMELAEKGDHIVSVSALKSLIRLQQSTRLRVGNQFFVRNIKILGNNYRNIIYIIHTLRRLNDQIDTTIPGSNEEKEARAGLLKLLVQWVDKPKPRAIYLLNLKYPIENLEPMSQILLHGNLDQKINAVEFMENTFHFRIRRALIPIVESMLVTSEDKHKEMFEKLGSKELQEFECLEILLSQNSIKARHAVLYLISKIRDIRYIPLVKNHLNDFHLKIQEHAKDTLKVLELEKVRV